MHAEITELMSSVLDGEATEHESSRLHEHIATCQECASVWAQWNNLHLRLSSAPMMMPGPGLYFRVAEQLESRRQRSLDHRWLGSGLLLAWGGLLMVLTLLAAGAAWWCWMHPAEMGSLVSSGAQILSGLSALLRALGTVRDTVGVLPFSLGIGFYIGFTALLLALWTWLVHRGGVWLRAGQRVTE